MTRPALRIPAVVWVLCLALSTFARPAAAGSAVCPAPDRTPRPCLVPPVPPRKAPTPNIGGAANLDAQFRPQQRRLLQPLSTTGGPVRLRILAIRVDFEDQVMDSTEAYFQRLLLFKSEHYAQSSGGRLILEPTLAPRVYRMPQTMAYYGDDDSLGLRQVILAYDAVQAADADVDYADFDQVVMFHAGPGQESDVNDDSREQIWSVFFRQVDFEFYLPYYGADRGILTQDRTAAGDTLFVPSVGMFPETETQDGFVFSPVGVVCHEFGHALGLPDLYDTTAPDGFDFAESQGVGSWDLMGSGTWNANGFVPAELSAWSKVFLGWIDPVVITTDTDVSLEAIELNRTTAVVKIPIGGNEYFLIENRLQDVNGDGRFNFAENDSSGCFYQRRGTDSTLVCNFDYYVDSYENAEWDYWLPGEGKGSGLLIWHIDQSVIDQNLFYNTVNAEALHKGIDLEEADGIQDMDFFAIDINSFGSPHDVWRAGGADRFAPDTEPNTDGYYGAASHITIDQISAPGPVMTFRVRFGDGHDEWPVTTASPIGAQHVGIADMDLDADREVVVVDSLGAIHVLNPDGSAAWTGAGGKVFRDLGVSVASSLLADVDGDERTDLLVLTDAGDLYGFRGADGAPMGQSETGWLLKSENPMAGVELWSFDANPSVPGVEFAFGGSAVDGQSRVSFHSVSLDGRPVLRGTASLHGGNGPFASVVVDVDGSGGLAMVSSVRGGTAEAPRGAVQLVLLDAVSGGSLSGGAYSNAPLPDTLLYSAPVAADLNRNGLMDVVVTASDGNIYALEMSVAGGRPRLDRMPGWPKPIFASGRDAVSLADVDGNGYVEVLAIETGGVLHVMNYHGENLISLPEQFSSEVRYFIEPQLAPLAVDLTGNGRPDLLLPLGDGQLLGVRADGSRLGNMNFFGGSWHGSSPAVDDLDGDGRIELAYASNHVSGGRIDVRTIGRAAGPPQWGMHRRNGGRDGRIDPRDERPVNNGADLSDVFAMPNPARVSTRIHFHAGAGAGEATVEVVDMLGRGVRTLPTQVFPGTDNFVRWDLMDASGRPVAPGVYFALIETRGAGGSRTARVKIAVLR